MLRRSFLATGVSAAAAQVSARSFELDDIPLSQLSEGLRSGRWTSRKLAELYLRRIEEVDRKGPQLRAIIELNPDVLRDADRLDRERKNGGANGPLFGIPILLKDNIDSAGRMATSAGSLALENWHAPQDAIVTARLRSA